MPIIEGSIRVVDTIRSRVMRGDYSDYVKGPYPMGGIPDDFSRRMGCVKIRKFLVDENPRAVMTALADGIIFRCEFMYSTGDLEYRLMHVAFDPIPSGELMPEYECIFTMHADRTVTHEWRRKP